MDRLEQERESGRRTRRPLVAELDTDALVLSPSLRTRPRALTLSSRGSPRNPPRTASSRDLFSEDAAGNASETSTGTGTRTRQRLARDRELLRRAAVDDSDAAGVSDARRRRPEAAQRSRTLTPPTVSGSPQRQRARARDRRDSDSVGVAVRVRRFLPRDRRREQDPGECVVNFKKSTCMIVAKDHRPPTFTFTFDHCVWSAGESTDPDAPPSVNQFSLYHQLGKGLLDNAWKGLNSSLVAYGQTGSGKTYSIFGPPEVPMGELLSSSSRGTLHPEAGLVPRIFADLFQRLEASEPENYIVEVAMVEIYMERVFDLLARRAHRDVRGTNELGFVVEKLTKRRVTGWPDVAEFLKEANAQKVVASTAMNQTSSRAHTLMEIYLRKLLEDAQGPPYSAKVTVVDLAGSENVKLSEVVGEQSRQASIINLSLMELGKVVEAVVARENQRDSTDVSVLEGRRESACSLPSSAPQSHPPRKAPHISFRGSVLTKLLKESIGGNSKSTILVTISPALADVAQTVSALRFADRAKHLRSHAKFNEDAFSEARTHRAIVEEGHRRQGALLQLEREHFELLGRQALNEREAAELRREQKRLQLCLSALPGADCGEAVQLRRGLAEVEEKQRQGAVTAVCLKERLERVQQKMEKHGAAMRQLTGAVMSGAASSDEGPAVQNFAAAQLTEKYEREVRRLRQSLRDSEEARRAESSLAQQQAAADARETCDRLRYEMEQLKIEAAAKEFQREREREAARRREASLWERMELLEGKGSKVECSDTQELLERELDRVRQKVDDDAAMSSARLEHEASLRQQDARRHAAERERWRREKRRLEQEVQRERGESQRLGDEREHLLDRLSRLEEQERRQWDQKNEWRARCQGLMRELHAQDRQHEDSAAALLQKLERLKAVMRRSSAKWRQQLQEAHAEAVERGANTQASLAHQLAQLLKESSETAAARWTSMLSLHEKQQQAMQQEADRLADTDSEQGAGAEEARARRGALLAEVGSALTDPESCQGTSPTARPRRHRAATGSSAGDSAPGEVDVPARAASAGVSPRSRSSSRHQPSPDPRPPPPAPVHVADTVSSHARPSAGGEIGSSVIDSGGPPSPVAPLPVAAGGGWEASFESGLMAGLGDVAATVDSSVAPIRPSLADNMRQQPRGGGSSGTGGSRSPSPSPSLGCSFFSADAPDRQGRSSSSHTKELPQPRRDSAAGPFSVTLPQQPGQSRRREGREADLPGLSQLPRARSSGRVQVRPRPACEGPISPHLNRTSSTTSSSSTPQRRRRELRSLSVSSSSLSATERWRQRQQHRPRQLAAGC
eukprot:TRINITY_DN1424_c0_g1_i1.p1 TRINITY_DN1424_c0_g1~~TRINITY_DN1424_c0_g1_i1.p1  ORF type:complete len:1311 (+),score=437.91 TRINITY_DN1424_c0_g1_i1:77-4009(+)